MPSWTRAPGVARENFLSGGPDTIEWLDQLQPADTLWDIGANVGLYSIYAAKFRKCAVHAFEPESQNYALLIDNIALNDVGDNISASSIALNDVEKFGKLIVPFVTKGGAYNFFASSADATNDVPETIRAAQNYFVPSRVIQHTFASSIDNLVYQHGLTPPSHVKIDVDGNEYKIINGAMRMLQNPRLKSILIELNEKSKSDGEVHGLLERNGFQLLKTRSVWVSKPNKKLQAEMPVYNAIFVRRN